MRVITNYAVIILAILFAELLHAIALYYQSQYLKGASAYKKVGISMVAAVIVFYPVFRLLDKYIRGMSHKYVKKAKSITGSSLLGLLLGFSLAVFLLFASFSYIWFNKNVFTDIKRWLLNIF